MTFTVGYANPKQEPFITHFNLFIYVRGNKCMSMGGWAHRHIMGGHTHIGATTGLACSNRLVLVHVLNVNYRMSKY
jgi:hypothetical protein